MDQRPGLPARLAAAALAALLAAGLMACGGEEEAAPTKLEKIPVAALPPEVLGLAVGEEAITEQIKGAGRVYVSDVGLFSLRREEALQATLQVARLNDEAKWRDGRFRRSIVNGIATSRPTELRMGDHDVFLSTSLRQTVAIWFRDRYLYVLSTREEFEQPWSLLRALTDLEVKV